MVQVPALTIVTRPLPLSRVHTPSVADANATVRPELAIALTPNAALPNVLLETGGKEIVCGRRTAVSVTSLPSPPAYEIRSVKLRKLMRAPSALQAKSMAGIAPPSV